MQDEAKACLAFLRSLKSIAWDRGGDEARKEGNFWLLLYNLRKLGLDALVWNDEEENEAACAEELEAYLQTLAERIESSPKALVEATMAQTDDCPLLLRRRRQIQSWLEQCFSAELPADVTTPRKGTPDLSSNLLKTQGFTETSTDPVILKNSLALLLAGRLEDAKQLARDSDASWRAAVWSGGVPDNPNRPVWRRMMWGLAKQLHEKAGGNADEAAISALLSSNLDIALENPSLRTWEKCLYAIVRAVNDRMEDELLYMHNNRRRKERPPYPGTQYENKERDQLEATSSLAGLNEVGIVKVLQSHPALVHAPLEEMKCTDPLSTATLYFLVGERAIADVMDQAVRHGEESGDEEFLRFATHLALYLDSLSSCADPIEIEGMTGWKNELLLLYVRVLASREDLWFMLVLYASLLPEEIIIDQLPPLLVTMESQEERELVVKELSEFLFTRGLDLALLRRVVDLICSEEEIPASADTITRLDIRKMKSVLWLTFSNEHAGDALISADTLLRQFLLASKLPSAIMFVEDVLPEKIIGTALEQAEHADGDQAMGDYVDSVRIEHALSEYDALQSYLEAIKSFEQWKETMEATDANAGEVSSGIDKSVLNKPQLSMAERLERRQLLEEKRKASQKLVSAADEAQKALFGVLTHQGGWLVTEDEVLGGGDEEMLRRNELQKLRCRLLPQAVTDHMTVCLDTAKWMFHSLNDAVERLGDKPLIALELLEESKNISSSPLVPHFWSQKALELSHVITSTSYKIQSALNASEQAELTNRLAEATATNLVYESVLRE
jgi:hypothetical protein